MFFIREKKIALVKIKGQAVGISKIVNPIMKSHQTNLNLIIIIRIEAY